MSYCTPIVEYSTDPLSVTTPTWQDVTRFVQSVSWFAGTDQDLDAPQSGGCTIVLKNGDRRFEPGYSGSPYYPSVVPLRRFRISIVADGATVRQGVFYVRSWDIDYPGGTSYSTATATCTDGFALLSLYTLPALDPPTATSYSDVVEADAPIAYYHLDELVGKTTHAATGNDGRYRGNPGYGRASTIVGDPDTCVLFPAGSFTYANVPLSNSDLTVLQDSGEFTVEAVIRDTSPATNRTITAWGFVTPNAYQIRLTNEQASIRASGATVSTVGDVASSGTHHIAATWDGQTLRYYRDGVLLQTAFNTAPLDTSATGEDIYIGAGGPHESGAPSADTDIAHVAYYDYALSPGRIAAHGTAAISRGYTAELTGSRIANIATHPLWSTSNIATGSYTVAPRMQTGQPKLDEITTTVNAEQPFGLFWFDDQGRPAYRGADYTTTIQAVFGDSGSDIRYTDITFAYDDALYNTVTASRDNGGTAQTRTDPTSISAYGARAYTADGLILSNDQDVALVAAGIQEHFSQPMLRITSITLNGSDQRARTQLLNRDIGDTIRIRRRGDTTQPIDIITRILRKEKSIDTNGNLTCTWTLARGFPASPTVWRLGQAGYSEIGVTTVLG
jgi:hypothetical protein